MSNTIRKADYIGTNSGTLKRKGKKNLPNDPCPCGSGLKFKKCCYDPGKRAIIRVKQGV